MAVAFDDDDIIYTVRVPVTVMPITFYCLFYADVLNLNRQMMSLEENGGDQWYRMFHGSQEASSYKRNGGLTPIANTTGTFSISTWHAASITFLNHNSMSVYWDGGNKGTQGSGATPDGGQFNVFRFGGASFIGGLAELTVWDANFNDEDHAYIGQHIAGNSYRPEDLVFYASLVDSYYETIGDENLLTGGDPSFIAHPTLLQEDAIYGPQIQII